MSDSRVIRKLPVLALVFLLCLGVLLPGAVGSAWADDTKRPQLPEQPQLTEAELKTVAGVTKVVVAAEGALDVLPAAVKGLSKDEAAELVAKVVLATKNADQVARSLKQTFSDSLKTAAADQRTGLETNLKAANGLVGRAKRAFDAATAKENELRPGAAATEKDAAVEEAAEEAARNSVFSAGQKVTSGSCYWQYVKDGDEYIFKIAPTNDVSGTLEEFEGRPIPWLEGDYAVAAKSVKSISVEGAVKTGKNIAGMFKGFEKVTKIDLSGLDTSEATDMSGMFAGCKVLAELDVNDLDTSKVKNMSLMFGGCESLERLALNGADWDTAKVTNFAGIFHGCKALKELDISTWTLGKSVDKDKAKIFDGLPRLQKLTISHKVNLKNTGVEKLFGKHVTWSTTGEDAITFKTAAALKRFHANKRHLDGAETYLRAKKRGTWKKDADGLVSCVQDGRPLTGWQLLQGTVKDSSARVDNWFYFDDDGFMLTGKHKLAGGLPNKDGVVEEHWFYFDEETGAQVRGWVEEKGVWHYYSQEDGTGLANGRYELEGGKEGGKHWFGFDKDGNQVRGWHNIDDQWYYYAHEDGTGLIGQHELEGGKEGGKHWFYFDEKTGAEIRGWKHIDYQDKWCYYSTEDGTMLKGQHELEGGDKGGKNWFYFDEVTGAQLRNCWKEIPSQGKTCYYGSDGAMYKGTHMVDGQERHFDPVTGAVV